LSYFSIAIGTAPNDSLEFNQMLIKIKINLFTLNNLSNNTDPNDF
jgi:hypothetical protein